MRIARRSGWPWTHVGAAALAVAFTGSLGAQALKVGTLRIESVPSAAEVELIGGKAGVTPLAVSERDIYPNDYDDARADLYGMVVLRHPGCEPLRHRVTMTDIKQGLQLQLTCDATAAQSAAPPVTPSPPRSAAPQDTSSQHRLRQLQVLQELRDEGLISAAEEERVRRQILKQAAELPGQ